MKKVSSLNPLQPIASFFDRFNLVSFIVLVVGGLVVSIMILTNILMRTYDNGNVTSTGSNNTTSNTFDQLTIGRLIKLENSSTNSGYKSATSGRNNPFSE